MIHIHFTKRTPSLISSAILVMFILPSAQGQEGITTKGLNVYKAIPGISPSTRFAVRVSEVKTRKWFNLFTMETVSLEGKGYDSVKGYSSSWATFEYDVPVEVQIKKLSPGPIEQCIVRPQARQILCEVSPDKTTVSITIPVRKVARNKITTTSDQAPVNITVEINGQTKETISIFASPHLAQKPLPTDPGVFCVKPGTKPPADGKWTTLYFLPGIHKFGKKAYKMQANKSYYIPGDAWIESPIAGGGDKTRIFGLGVMSQRTIIRAEQDRGEADKMLSINGRNSVIEGLTLVDSQNHTLFGSGSDVDNPVVIRNVKMHNWQINSDGIHFFQPGIAEDCFFRTQDDMHYTYNRSIFRRMVYWKDETFGTDILFPGWAGGLTSDSSRTEDSDTIYYNSEWVGANIEFRDFGNSKQNGGTVDGFRIEKPGKKGDMPFILLAINKNSKTAYIKNMLFKDIHVINDLGSRIRLVGQPNCFIEDITFQDIRIGDRWVEDFSDKNFSEIKNARNLKIVRNGKTVATYSSGQ